MAAVTRMRMDSETRGYLAKRTWQGHTPREIRRALKRYLARQVYRQFNVANTLRPSLEQRRRSNWPQVGLGHAGRVFSGGSGTRTALFGLELVNGAS